EDADDHHCARRGDAREAAPPRDRGEDQLSGADPGGHRRPAQASGAGPLAMRGQGRIFRRKQTASWWLSYYHNGEEILESARTSSERKAQALLRERLRTADTAAFVTPQAQRLRFEDLMDILRADHARKGNRSRLEYKIARLGEAFAGDMALTITTARID